MKVLTVAYIMCLALLSAVCLTVLFFLASNGSTSHLEQKRGRQRENTSVSSNNLGPFALGVGLQAHSKSIKSTSHELTNPQASAIHHMANATELINPGCRERKLGKYKPVDTGRVYHYPPIVHYAKLTRFQGTVSLNFREYMSVLSAWKFIQPERIIFHTYTKIDGKYWDKVKQLKNVTVEVNKVPRVHTIGGRHVTWVEHEADYIKLRALHQYGGLAMDFDVIIVNGTKLHQEQRVSECVLSQEGEYINGGFYSCIKDSSFIAKWLEGYKKDYRPSLWIHNVSFKPTGILEDKTSDVCYNVYLDSTISVNPNAGQTSQWLGNKVQWQTKTAAHYFLKKGIPNDDERLLQDNHSLAQLLRHVQEA